MALSNYLQETADMLKDPNFLFTSQSKLTRYINEARRQIAQRTGCVRRLVAGQSAFGANSQPGSFVPGGAQPGALPGAVPKASGMAVTGAAVNSLQTIQGQERYPYIGFFNPYVEATYDGVKGIIDVNTCSVSWGSARPTLAWMPWEDLQAYARAYATLVTSYPFMWSCYNDGETGEVWMFPAPSSPGDIELDAFCVPKDLNSDDDYDAIPSGFRNAVKFGAASLAYLSSKRYSDAGIMDSLFTDRVGTGSVARDRGKTPNAYWRAI